MAKILFGPDLHYGYDNAPGRLDEWRRCAQALVALVELHKVEVVLMPGDAFTSGKHTSGAIIDVYGLYDDLEKAGTAVIGTFGNHDYAGADKAGPVDALAEIGDYVWGIKTPRLVNVDYGQRNNPSGEPEGRIQVAVLPWTKATALLQESEGHGDMVGRASDALVAILRGLAAQIDPSIPSILLGHWPVAGCIMSSGQTLMGGEPALSLGELQAGPWSIVVMGHIHKRQEFPGLPLVLHTGALTRRDFGEEKDDCGCYIFDTDTGVATWHPLPARKFFTWNLNPTEVQALAAGEKFALYDQSIFAKDAVCRVKYRATEEQHRAIDQGALIRALEEMGAYHVAGVFPEIIRSDRTRANVTGETRALDSLNQWLDLRTDLSPDLKAEIRAAAARLAEESNGVVDIEAFRELRDLILIGHAKEVE